MRVGLNLSDDREFFVSFMSIVLFFFPVVLGDDTPIINRKQQNTQSQNNEGQDKQHRFIQFVVWLLYFLLKIKGITAKIYFASHFMIV